MRKQYDILHIQQYIEGNLSPQDMHKLELDALEDAMLQDAIDGYRSSHAFDHKQLSLLQQRLEKRIEAHQIEKNTFYFTGQRLAIASVAGVLLIVFGILFWMTNQHRITNQASNAEQQVVVHVKDNVKVSLLSGSIAPKGGWANFQDYLSVNGIQIAEEESINVSFDIKENRPYNIKVLSSVNNELSQQLIKLLEQGPLWDGKSGEIIIAF